MALFIRCQSVGYLKLRDGYIINVQRSTSKRLVLISKFDNTHTNLKGATAFRVRCPQLHEERRTVKCKRLFAFSVEPTQLTISCILHMVSKYIKVWSVLLYKGRGGLYTLIQIPRLNYIVSAAVRPAVLRGRWLYKISHTIAVIHMTHAIKRLLSL